MHNIKTTKMIAFLLCVVLMAGVLIACKGNNGGEETTQAIETVDATLIDMEPLNPTEELSFFVDAKFENSISFSIPKHLANKCHTQVANSFSEGWFKLTVCLGGESMSPECKLFTIYGYKYPTQDQYASEKNFSTVACDGVYTYVWFEYDHSDVSNEQIKQEIENFERQYENIKESIQAIYEPKSQTETAE